MLVRRSLTVNPSVATFKRIIQHALHRPEDSTASEVDLCDEGSVKDFLQVVQDGKEPINCLDVPQVAGPAPVIIKYVSTTAPRLLTLISPHFQTADCRTTAQRGGLQEGSGTQKYESVPTVSSHSTRPTAGPKSRVSPAPKNKTPTRGI